MQTRLRRVLDAFTTGLAWVMMRVFFRDIEVAGLERVPRGVPVVVVANHANSIVDPMLMLAFLGIKPRILAKSTLWRHPVIAPFLVVAGAIPVFRPKEANPARNVETFARCGEALAEGKAIALFPEGTSHDKPTLQPLKTGAARMVLQAQDAHEGLQVLVLPVGLIYEAKDRFRSRVVVNVGEAIVPAPAATGSLSARAAAARSLTRQIAEGLGRVVVTWAAWQAGRADATRRSATSQAGPLTPLAHAVALLGAALNWAPYKIPGWVASGVRATADGSATYKLFAALFTFPIFWLLDGLLVGAFFGSGWGIPATVLTPFAGLAALCLLDRNKPR
jgi:1-acyl-sn-glycerol-3-phosphate acyltransferase